MGHTGQRAVGMRWDQLYWVSIDRSGLESAGQGWHRVSWTGIGLVRKHHWGGLSSIELNAIGWTALGAERLDWDLSYWTEIGCTALCCVRVHEDRLGCAEICWNRLKSVGMNRDCSELL